MQVFMYVLFIFKTWQCLWLNLLLFNFMVRDMDPSIVSWLKGHGSDPCNWVQQLRTFSRSILTSVSRLCFFVWYGLLSRASKFASPAPGSNRRWLIDCASGWLVRFCRISIQKWNKSCVSLHPPSKIMHMSHYYLSMRPKPLKSTQFSIDLIQ